MEIAMNNTGKVIGSGSASKPLFEGEDVFERPDGLAVAVTWVYSDGMRECDIVSLNNPMWPLGTVEISETELSAYPRLGTRAEMAAAASTMSRRARITSYLKGRVFAMRWMRERVYQSNSQATWRMPTNSWLRE